jgi:hypothetical protein
MLHFTDLLHRIGASAAEPDITGVVVNKGDLGDVVDQGYSVALVQPVMELEGSQRAARRGAFDRACGKVDAKGRALAAGGESPGQDTGEEQAERDGMLHGNGRRQR